MSNKNEAYNDVELFDHINQKSKDQSETEQSAILSYYADREKTRKFSIVRNGFCCILSAIAWVLLCLACTEDLIAPVIVFPATYLCAVWFGWYLCKVVRKIRKGKRQCFIRMTL